jgi:hypothetical protein
VYNFVYKCKENKAQIFTKVRDSKIETLKNSYVSRACYSHHPTKIDENFLSRQAYPEFDCSSLLSEWNSLFKQMETIGLCSCASSLSIIMFVLPSTADDLDVFVFERK